MRLLSAALLLAPVAAFAGGNFGGMPGNGGKTTCVGSCDVTTPSTTNSQPPAATTPPAATPPPAPPPSSSPPNPAPTQDPGPTQTPSPTQTPPPAQTPPPPQASAPPAPPPTTPLPQTASAGSSTSGAGNPISSAWSSLKNAFGGGARAVETRDLDAVDRAKLQGAAADQPLEAGLAPNAPPSAAALAAQKAVQAQNDALLRRSVGAIAGPDGKSPLEAQKEALIRSSKTKFQLRDFEGAAQDAGRLIDLDPGDVAAYVRRAGAWNRMLRHAEAEKDGLEAVRLDPNNEQAWRELAWAYLKEGKYALARDAASKAIALNPADAEAYMIRAFAEEKLGDRDAEVRDLETAAALDGRFKPKLDAARAGGKVFDEQDPNSLADELSAQKTGSPHGGVPWMPLAGGLAGLAFVSFGVAALSRRRSERAPQVTKVALQPPTPMQPKAPRTPRAPGRARTPATPSRPKTPRSAAAPRTPRTPKAPQLMPSSGGQVLGKYELGAVIGRGGMGTVYKAKDLSLGRPVAIKKMTENLNELNPQARSLFIAEARTVAQLHHPAIVDIYEILEKSGELYMVFEYVQGKTVHHMLAEGRLELARAAQILKPVCAALTFAHKNGLVHRDLKPANIMVTDDELVKLMDFGIARSLSDAQIRAATMKGGQQALFARTTTIYGTPYYMAPEAEAGVVCKEGDVYSLGVTLYEMLTARVPFPGGTALEKSGAYPPAGRVVPALPPAVDELLAAALQPAPEKRPRTPAEFAALLERAAA